jgi:hypothetical protein
VLLENCLFPETEFLEEPAVALQVVLAEVVEQALALSYHFHQSSVRGKVLLVLLKVLGNVVDPLGQEGNLALDGSRVFGISAEFGEYPGFLFGCNT